ncbi:MULTISPECIES: cysteine synthase family protein [Oceanobacillus]|uniref:Cysteine synthase n=1 Tax=Oceanobacillus kimchii TaxID=746691 RepID=A0ABQ5TFB3_9BACI|nr:MULTISPECIES: cysteine synthase family protein [Oceanobacillus]MBT2599182.1 cysteine synthase family protein [Oceanobacillus sp. ISL-74]MBT2652100.1 cysteine synthase family protein [Oceanobacillus sp. ISL-73]OEH54257.1 cysteine synthase [Oceanobacillus sp. E9]GLO65559.1 cysteine synthase [Oceanobacillus kimchii]
MAIYESIQQLIGNTPLLKINEMDIPNNVHLYAKLEFLNPGGSVKDRLGQYLIDKAWEKGFLKEGSTIIEPTAGNTGIGLALAARKKQLSIIFCVPEQFSVEKQQIMKALGATIVHTPKEKGMIGAIEKAEQLVDEIPNSYSPQQFSNKFNPMTYYETMAPEIWNDLQGNIDIFVAGAGSGGTFTGVARYFKERKNSIHNVIVEPFGSILGGAKAGPHLTEGIGMEFIPEYMNQTLMDEVQTIPDKEAFLMVEELARKEGLLVGSSSGSAMVAALNKAKEATSGTTIVTILPDGSDRYLSKQIYNVSKQL